MYRNSIDIIANGVEACWRNAVKTIDAAKTLKSQGYKGLCLSLSVLAMEEIGKLTLIDGLLFAKSNDERSTLFEKGFRSHKTKLSAIDVFPFLINYLATLDPRNNKEQRFNLTLAIVLAQYKQDRLALARWIGSECDLQVLDDWKQKGFYTHYDSGGQFVSPSEIDSTFSDVVFQIANRIVDGVNFVLKDNIENYKETVRKLREKLPDEQLLKIRQHAEEIINELFGPPTEEERGSG